MGVWDETCALTNTAIFADEPCIMVRLRPSVFRYEPERQPFGGNELAWADLIDIHEGTYDEYGWLKDLPASRNLRREDYPYLQDYEFSLEDDPRRHEVVIFFHLSVWMDCQEEPMREQQDFIAYQSKRERRANSIPRFVEFLRVLTVASRARRDILSGRLYSGHQEREEFLSAQTLLHTRTGQILTRQAQKYEEWKAEESEERCLPTSSD